MKKTLLLLLVALTTSLSANAFGEFRLGATAGYNLTRVSYDRATLDQTLRGKNGTGWYVGAKAHLGLFLGLGLDASLIYNQRDYKLGAGPVTISHKAKSVDLPLNARWDLTLGGLGAYVAAGPNFSFNVSDRDWNASSLLKDASFESLSKKASEVTDGVFRQDNLVTSLNVGGGLRFSKSLEVGVTYTIPMSETGKALLKDAGIQGSTALPSYKANQWSVNATLYF